MGAANPIPPSEWRRGNRQANADVDDRDEFEPPGPDSQTRMFQCGTKRTCRYAAYEAPDGVLTVAISEYDEKFEKLLHYRQRAPKLVH
jgi:hypothetical protein